MSWQLFTAISVLTLSASVLLQRLLLGKDKIDPFAYASVFQLTVGILLSFVAIISGFRLPNIELYLLPAFISFITFGVGHIFIAKSLQTVEASVFSVLFASQSIWIMLLGIVLFQERLSVLQIIGSVLIFASVLMLVNKRLFDVEKGTFYGLAAGALFAIAITAWSYVGRHTDGISWAAISFYGTALVAFLAKPNAYKKMGALFAPSVLRKLLVLGVFYAIGSLTMLYAYKEGLYSVVTPLRQSSIIVTTILAVALLPGERDSMARKIMASLTCFAGVVMIVI